jgi:hypothetical protein
MPKPEFEVVTIFRSQDMGLQILQPQGDTKALKVPKREIFDRSDFPDFYTIRFHR